MTQRDKYAEPRSVKWIALADGVALALADPARAVKALATLWGMDEIGTRESLGRSAEELFRLVELQGELPW